MPTRLESCFSVYRADASPQRCVARLTAAASHRGDNFPPASPPHRLPTPPRHSILPRPAPARTAAPCPEAVPSLQVRRASTSKHRAATRSRQNTSERSCPAPAGGCSGAQRVPRPRCRIKMLHQPAVDLLTGRPAGAVRQADAVPAGSRIKNAASAGSGTNCKKKKKVQAQMDARSAVEPPSSAARGRARGRLNSTDH